MRLLNAINTAGVKRRAMVVGTLLFGLVTQTLGIWGSMPETAAAGIDSISPTAGSVPGGETLTVTGSGFKSDYGDYVPVDYIQFYKDAGTAYYPLIDTGIQLKAATQVSVTYRVTTYGIQYVWGALSGSEIHLASGDGDPQNNNDTTAWQYFYYGSSGQSFAQFASLATSSGKIKVTAGNGSFAASLLEGTGHIYTASATYTAYGNSANIIIGARQTGYFTGRIYGFSIVNGTVGNDNNVAFNGMPAYSPQSNQYGLYDTVSGHFFANSKGGNGLIEGQIWGPSGIGGAAPKPPVVSVDFSGQNSQGSSVSVPCAPLTIVSSTQATCPVPPSMFGGDGSGTAQVKVTVTDTSGTNTATFPYNYETDKPALLLVTPDKGPMTGSASVTLTGKKFVTQLDSLQFGGVTIDTPPGTHPAAWTVSNQTVYGFADAATGELTPAAEGDGVVGILSGQAFPVAPTTVAFGQTPAQTVTVLSATTMTVTAPPHDPATVDVSIDKNGLTALMASAYTYVATGTLELSMQGWACPANATLDDVQTPGVCQLIPDGGYAVSGTTVTWLYTATYVSLGLNGTPLDPSLGQLTGVTVTDAKLGQVCTVASLPLNTPYPCVASGPVLTT